METKSFFLRGDYGTSDVYVPTANCISVAWSSSGERNANSLQDAILMVEQGLAEKFEEGAYPRWLYLIVVPC
jgi:hypothetical protein